MEKVWLLVKQMIKVNGIGQTLLTGTSRIFQRGLLLEVDMVLGSSYFTYTAYTVENLLTLHEVTVLLEHFTDCSIRVSRFVVIVWPNSGHFGRGEAAHIYHCNS